MGGTQSILERLERYKIIESGTGCWRWSGTRVLGYGILRIDNKNIRVHRLSANIYLGLNLNSDLYACHKVICLNKDCWNYDHLYIGTHQDNSNDEVLKRTHCPRGHEYNSNNSRIYTNRSGVKCRVCRVCDRLRDLDRKYVNGKRIKIVT